MSNAFLTAVRQHDTYTENGAVSNSTTGDHLLDYFSKCGTYRDRSIEAVYRDVATMWSESPKIALQILFYLRMISRKVIGLNTVTEKVQNGQGARDEFRKALSWVAKHHPGIFARNLQLVPIIGCWKDLWHKDLEPFIDRKDLLSLIRAGMSNDYHRALIAKYLPAIKSRKKATTPEHWRKNRFAKWLCEEFHWSDREYRQFKASGESHQFQRDMSASRWSQLDFSRIPGKALFTLVNHTGKDGKSTIERHSLVERYEKWLDTQPVAKFTGYPYELLKQAGNAWEGINLGTLSRVQKKTINKQFDGLIEKARQNREGLQGNVWCALDTSGSMYTEVVPGVSAHKICVSLGIFFATLNEGAFHNHVIEFDDTSRVKKLSGTFTDKVGQVRSNAMGGTNFQSVIDEIVRVRKSNPNIPVEDYPSTLLIVSDMQFNPTESSFSYNSGRVTARSVKTNYEAAMRKLRAVGLPDIQIIWWQVTGRTKDFPSTAEDAGTVLIGGFDGAVITNILGGQQTTVDEKTGKTRKLNAYENMLKALDQEILSLVSI